MGGVMTTSWEGRYRRPGSHPWDGHPDVRVIYTGTAGVIAASTGAVAGPRVAADTVKSWPEPVFYSTPMGPPVVVDVDAAVLDQIEAAWCRVNGFAIGGREVGGYIFESPRTGRIMYASDSTTENAEGSCRLDDRCETEARHAVPGVLEIAGSWHVHSGGGSKPSQADLSSCDAQLLNYGLERWYSLIATRAEFGGWYLAGLVTRRYAGSDRSKTEPMQVVFE
jgi:hypothetical protein